MSQVGVHPDDDMSPRAHLQRAIRGVQRERFAGIGLAVVVALGSALREGLTFTTGPEALLLAILVALLFLYAQVCALRIDRLRERMLDLPPKGGL